VLDVNLQHTAVAERLIPAAQLVAGPALEAIRSDHLSGRVTYGTFGLTPQVLNAVRAGQIAFAIDRQEYLQGYLPIVLLTQYHLYGVLPDRGKLISTGPVFITRQNAAHVLELSNQGCAVTPMATFALQEKRALISAAPRARDPTAPPWR
jgi:simple sugar transport system substrate-binding protein